MVRRRRGPWQHRPLHPFLRPVSDAAVTHSSSDKRTVSQVRCRRAYRSDGRIFSIREFILQLEGVVLGWVCVAETLACCLLFSSAHGFVNTFKVSLCSILLPMKSPFDFQLLLAFCLWNQTSLCSTLKAFFPPSPLGSYISPHLHEWMNSYFHLQLSLMWM